MDDFRILETASPSCMQPEFQYDNIKASYYFLTQDLVLSEQQSIIPLNCLTSKLKYSCMHAHKDQWPCNWPSNCLSSLEHACHTIERWSRCMWQYQSIVVKLLFCFVWQYEYTSSACLMPWSTINFGMLNKLRAHENYWQHMSKRIRILSMVQFWSTNRCKN